jgi:hypothetical protein
MKASARIAPMATGAVVLCIAAIGMLHTSAGRGAMALLGVPCPVDKVSAQQVSLARNIALDRVRGTRPAPAQPALGMQLGRFTSSDVRAWQQREGVACDAITRGFTYLRCRGVPAHALGVAGPAISEVWFSFDARGRLVGVDSYRRGLDDAGAELVWSNAQARLERELGTPSRSVGDGSAAALRTFAMQTARIEYRYSDYLATLTAVNLPHMGLAVREQYVLAN